MIGFSSLMDIDKLIQKTVLLYVPDGFSSPMDIDKLILLHDIGAFQRGFSSLMDIDKLIQRDGQPGRDSVLVL